MAMVPATPPVHRVLILDGNSEICARGWSDLGFLLFFIKINKKKKFIQKSPVSLPFTCAKHVLSYRLIVLWGDVRSHRDRG